MIRPVLSLTLMMACKGCFASCFQPGLPPDPPEDTGEEEDTAPEESAVDSVDTVDTSDPPPCAQPEIEPNYNATVATEIQMESYACGYFDAAYDFDVFAFENSEVAWIKIDVDAADRGSSANPVMSVESEEGFAAVIERGPDSNDPLMVFPAPLPDRWYVWMTDAHNGEGEEYDYRLISSVTKAPVTWTHREQEGIDHYSTAMEINEDMVVFGTSSEATEFDWFAFDPPDGKYKVRVTLDGHKYGSPLDARLMLYTLKENEDGSVSEVLRGYWDRSSTSSSLDPDFERSTDGEDIWYLKVRYRPTTQYGELYWYTLRVEVLE